MNIKALVVVAFLCSIAVLAIYSQAAPSQGTQTTGLFSLGEQSFGQRRTNLLNEILDEISIARLEGKYKCCIEPACTMCYLGNWIWQDGTCDCDGMIAIGEFDKVCPQCKRGIEEGRCISSLEESCEAGVVFE